MIASEIHFLFYKNELYIHINKTHDKLIYKKKLNAYRFLSFDMYNDIN